MNIYLMNIYLSAMLELYIKKLNELKSTGATSISIDTVLKMLDSIQSINSGEAPNPDFDSNNDLK